MSSTLLYLNILTFHFKIPTNVWLQLQPNNIITIKTYKFWILIRNKERRKIAFHMEVELWTWMFCELHWNVVSTVKKVRRNNFFCPKQIDTTEKSKWILSFMARTCTHNFEAIKLTGFQKNNYKVDFTCTSSIHYKTSHVQSAIKSLGFIFKFLGKFWNPYPYPIPSVTQLYVYC